MVPDYSRIFSNLTTALRDFEAVERLLQAPPSSATQAELIRLAGEMAALRQADRRYDPERGEQVRQTDNDVARGVATELHNLLTIAADEAKRLAPRLASVRDTLGGFSQTYRSLMQECKAAAPKPGPVDPRVQYSASRQPTVASTGE